MDPEIHQGFEVDTPKRLPTVYTQDNITTRIDCGMGTTSGAVALIGSKPHDDVIVDKVSPIQSCCRTHRRLFQ